MKIELCHDVIDALVADCLRQDLVSHRDDMDNGHPDDFDAAAARYAATKLLLEYYGG